ncbi:MAG TPA: NPCBM/NEW2 domain-containing protein [Prolixibacteraceae bacterium]
MKNAILVCCVFLLCSFSGEIEKTIWLNEMDLTLFDLEMGQAMKNTTMMGTPIIISGVSYENGVGVTAPAKYLIDLNGTGKRFYAEVGPSERKAPQRPEGPAPGGDDKRPAGNGAAPAGPPMPGGPRVTPTMDFYVLGDKQVLWHSGTMKDGDKAKIIDIEIGGIKKLALVVVSINGRGPFGGSAAWANAKISYSGDITPQAITNKTASGNILQILTPVESELPKINYPKVVGATQGKPFLFPIPVTGRKPFQVTVDNLPEGLVLDSSTGVISGTSPAKKGTYELNVTAENSLGEAKDKIDLKVGDLLALTPPMGWNSWNAGGMSVDQVKNPSCSRCDC